ncbi:MAG: hypothetical protein UX30_C0021G0008 [Candidatus Saccharibacteria bacterium GW2011_GWA2_46_10]|nr:MAG: hypothetical protein UX30_C0021G0008 [Candidatus Saccharibacteria bacterium GW2011_GWA2_46_10]
MEIIRIEEIAKIKKGFQSAPIVALLGPRQCGKTTLARQFASSWVPGKVHYFDLEDLRDLERLRDPLRALEGLQGLVVLDEVQERPDLFSSLRVLVDQKNKLKLLLLGSASPELLRQTSETLAGRIHYIEIAGFSMNTLRGKNMTRLWVRGGFPLSYLAKKDTLSLMWRKSFIKTFLEKDIPMLGFDISARVLERFWLMLAHYHGQVFNASEIANSLSVSDKTARHYLDILTSTFMVRQLQPWFYNTKKRIVKSPKIFFRDTGLLHALLAIEDEMILRRHPKLGASWEGFALEQVLTHLNLLDEKIYFWQVHSGASVDLLFFRHGRPWGIEVKFSGPLGLTKSIYSASTELELAGVCILHAGIKSYFLGKKELVCAIQDLPSLRLTPKGFQVKDKH